MSSTNGRDGGFRAAVLETMTLLSTLATAAEVRHEMAERRAGRDASAQEDEDVTRPYLAAARGELQEMLMRLHTSLVHARYLESEEGGATLVRRFDDLMKLNRVGRLLGLMHRRLLSLYPAVSEALVEEARLLQTGCDAVQTVESDRFFDALDPFLRRAMAFAAAVREEVG